MSAAIEGWIQRGAIPFPLTASNEFDSAVAQLLASLGDAIQLVGFGEALHGTEEILQIRNRLFQTLVRAHGYSAIVIETSFPQARAANEYVLGSLSSEDPRVKSWLSKGFGLLEANRELLEWMRQYNTNSAHTTKLRFYGFDIPLGDYAFASPRLVLTPPLDFLTSVGTPELAARKARIDELIGPDEEWENPGAIMDPSKSIGQSPRAASLRIETEELISALQIRAPELIAQRGCEAFHDALHDLLAARQLLNIHAAQARAGAYAEVLGIRDVLMADHLEYIVARERSRGKVLVYAHNGHLKRGQMKWEMGSVQHTWWPAGAQLAERIGGRYAVIGTAVGSSDDNGIAIPEENTLEARLIATPGEARFILTEPGRMIAPDQRATIPVRSGSKKNPTYFPLTHQCVDDYDALAVINTTTYNRGGLPLQTWG